MSRRLGCFLLFAMISNAIVCVRTHICVCMWARMRVSYTDVTSFLVLAYLIGEKFYLFKIFSLIITKI